MAVTTGFCRGPMSEEREVGREGERERGRGERERKGEKETGVSVFKVDC